MDQGTHVPVSVAQLSVESEYNASFTEWMTLANFRKLISELLKKYPDKVPEEAPLIILDSKSNVFMSGNVKDIKHTRHIARRVHFVRNGENCKMHNIDWCEGGLKLAYIAIKNVCEMI